MDKEKLKQIRYIKSEISAIEKQIEDLEPLMSRDKVVGSSPFFPYTAMSFNIEGVDIEDYDRRTRRLRNKLIRKREELLSLEEEIQSFIDGIEDNLTRQIIINRYINGYTWTKVANEISGNNTADGVRMLAKRFLESM